MNQLISYYNIKVFNCVVKFEYIIHSISYIVVKKKPIKYSSPNKTRSTNYSFIVPKSAFERKIRQNSAPTIETNQRANLTEIGPSLISELFKTSSRPNTRKIQTRQERTARANTETRTDVGSERELYTDRGTSYVRRTYANLRNEA